MDVIHLLETRASRSDWPAVVNEVRITVLVENRAPVKDVMLHYSWDSWASSWWLPLAYRHAATADDVPEAGSAPAKLAGWEVWETNLLLPPTAGGVDCALCVRMLGRESWDNNGGTNYRIEIPSENRHLPDQTFRS